ncbi:phosphotransferase, partial [Mycobacterium sp.]|uniref:phosphotransferase n=1 Tax=Mycobacterium sp. TaxID=1785 RepID=UPI002C0B8E6A
MPVSERPSPLERDILRVVEQWARPTGSIEDWSWPHGASAVYKVGTDRGDVVVKRVHRASSFAREVHAPGSTATAAGRDRDPLVHRHAGRVVARLHAAEEPDATTGYGETLLADFDTWSARAQQLVAPQDLDAARKIASAACHLGTVELVPAHCDNTPRNWMVDDGN